MFRLGFIRLRDGRRLAYSERGTLRGSPVIHQHGMPGSRLEDFGADSAMEALGIRMITPERPGYGYSDPQRRRTPMTFAADVLELADRLGIGRFGVTSLSGGGVYALALAAAAPSRVSAVALGSSPGPMQWPGASRQMRLLSRAGLWLGGRAPGALAALLAIAARPASTWPAVIVGQVRRRQPRADRRWLSIPSVQAGAVDNLHEALLAGGHGYAQDITILSRPWQVELARVAVPVRLWHGDADAVVPIAHARRLAGMIPGSHLIECPGEGHMLMWNRLPEMLRWLRDTADGAPPDGS